MAQRLPDDLRTNVIGRLFVAALILTCVVLMGATAYYRIGNGRWAWFDCLYMTIITLSTVGFAETLEGMQHIPMARVVTLLLILVGTGTLLYFLSNLTALVVEGDLQGMLRQRRMTGRIDRLKNHVIVCGAGNTGEHVIRELVAVGSPFVVIDLDEERVRVLAEDLATEILHVTGDATDDHALERAGVSRATGIIACLSEDKDNLFVTVTARDANRDARIVAKAVEASARRKLRLGGADAIVSPNRIGGMRLVAEMIRPAAVEFLDKVLHGGSRTLRIEDVTITNQSHLAGQTLADSDIRDIGALVIAVRTEGGEYTYNPGGDHELAPGDALIVIAEPDDVKRLRAAAG